MATSIPRIVSVCPENGKDYTDMENRRIFSTNGKLELRNGIFKETVLICPDRVEVSIALYNCEFKNGVHLRSEETCERIKLMLFESDVKGKVTIGSIREGRLSLDKANVDEVFVHGRFSEIDFFQSRLGLFQTEGLVCDFLRVERSNIEMYGLYKFRCEQVEFDTDNLAIKNWKRFKSIDNLSIRRCAEEYHLLALKSSRTISSNVAIRYQLAKATSHWTMLFFGYFYRPLAVVGWMTLVIVAFGFAYSAIFSKPFAEAAFFSVYTFFTIGYGTISSVSILQTLLVYLEAMLGVVYSAALLVSIMNTTRKTN